MSTRLYRSEEDRILGGVCGGIAEVYDMDPTLVRLVTLFLVLGMGSGLLIYLIAWLIVPTESEVNGDISSTESGTSESDGSSEEDSEDEETEAFECDECGREFDSKRGLSVHKGQKHKE